MKLKSILSSNEIKSKQELFDLMKRVDSFLKENMDKLRSDAVNVNTIAFVRTFEYPKTLDERGMKRLNAGFEGVFKIEKELLEDYNIEFNNILYSVSQKFENNKINDAVNETFKDENITIKDYFNGMVLAMHIKKDTDLDPSNVRYCVHTLNKKEDKYIIEETKEFDTLNKSKAFFQINSELDCRIEDLKNNLVYKLKLSEDSTKLDTQKLDIYSQQLNKDKIVYSDKWEKTKGDENLLEQINEKYSIGDNINSKPINRNR